MQYFGDGAIYGFFTSSVCKWHWWRAGGWWVEVATLVPDSLARARLVRVSLESRLACGECGPVWL